jgi:hypothetical protein
MNDPVTLQFFTEMVSFQMDTSLEALEFPPALTPRHRSIVRQLAVKLNLDCASQGVGSDGEYVIVSHRTTPRESTSITTVGNSTSPSHIPPGGASHISRSTMGRAI